MKQILMSDWSGSSWSDRLWVDRAIVGKKVAEILEKGVVQGTSLQKMTRELKQATNQSFNNAFRLIRTETSHIDGQVTLEGYKQAGEELELEYYEYDAFLDSRTSNICRELDKKRFKVSEAEVGVNYPPMHPNCRSTTQLVLDEEYKQEPKDFLIDNPKINDKTIKGSYNKKEIAQLQAIAYKYKELGYSPTGHAIQRTFERGIKPERVADVIKTGKKYTDGQKATGYYKNRVSVHISKETVLIKTVIFYDKGDTPPLKRNKNAKRKK